MAFAPRCAANASSVRVEISHANFYVFGSQIPTMHQIEFDNQANARDRSRSGLGQIRLAKCCRELMISNENIRTVIGRPDPSALFGIQPSINFAAHLSPSLFPNECI